ncbi:putative ATP-grasp enzyme [Candidatus Methanoperedens nitroreducens]|uniref:Putative ATP-grasp enzyme n=1 Tax=Candidatus Methanoperedens nitratireducens TaxID=1392998 RepID=A0A062V128_9EURY|nr:ATP-grasp domain-containing protein [Candidatus Methanoperedens nitroreducens]KCZ72836.1 putative ATP-grasp enzyme [Candidatus Methanoperedens nitroreducens]MDJ1423233.1 ATP-grasp domain-containing protein [Candidatus Methanoperedens sp.]
MSAVITAGDGNTALAITRSLGRKKIDTTVVSSNRYALTFFSKYCSRRIVSNNHIDFFSKLSDKDVVMPVDEDLMMLLAKNKARYKCRLPFSDYPVLEKLSNKSSLVKHAIENNIPCPKTYFVNGSDNLDRVGKEIGFPLLIKPDRGTGGRGIAIVDSPEELKSAYKHVLNNYGPLIIQEKVPFKEKYKLEFLLNRDSKVRRATILKVIRTYPLKTGPSTFVETVEQPDVLKLGMRFLEHLDYYGVADFDFVIDERDKKPKLLEINPRFWGSVQAAIAAGVDYPYLLYKMEEEGDIDVSLSYKTGLKCRHPVFSDLYHLLAILKGEYPVNYKLTELINYIKFHEDDAYYIFELEDIKPFLAWIPIKFLRRLKRITF